MAIVEGEESTSAPPLRKDDNAQIRESDVEIRVATFEVDDDTVVVSLQAADREAARRQVIEEGKTSAPSESTSEQIVDLGGHRSRDNELPGLLP